MYDLKYKYKFNFNIFLILIKFWSRLQLPTFLKTYSSLISVNVFIIIIF